MCSRPWRPLYSYILHQLYIKSLVIIISQSQLLLVSLVLDNCQLFYVVISTYNELKVLLTTWTSDNFVPFWQYYYRLTITLTSWATQTDLLRTDEWPCYLIPFETLILKGITQYMYGWGYFLDCDIYSSWIIHCFSNPSQLALVCV
jgi:hypothetical protein